VPSDLRNKRLPPEAYDYYMFHPIEFAEQQILHLTPQQVRANSIVHRLEPETKIILDAVAKNDYVSVHSGRGCTKTTSLALLIIWWVWTRNEARVMATGPKFDNLKATLWAEVRKWLDFSYLTDELELTSEKIYHKNEKMHSFGQMMTTKEKENISGIHATHVLWVVDEASNVEKEIIDAIIGGMNDPESKIIMTGNATRASGPFYDTHFKDRKNWKCIRFNTENSARKNRVWMERMRRYPRESDNYRVNVLGLPPLGNPKAIMSLADCHAARDRNVPLGTYLDMAVDPAREGNDLATIAIRQGMKMLEVRKFPKTKGPELRGHIITMLREYRRNTGIKSKIRIKIDDHGLGGPIGDELALNEEDNIEVVPCLFGGKGDDRYSDSASIMWFHMADMIDKVELCDDDDLIEQLSTREWIPASGRKLKVEPKQVYKDRTGNGCDEADVCILLYYSGPKKVFESPDEYIEDIPNTDFTIDWQYDRLRDPSFDGIFPVDILHYAALVLNDDLSITGLAGVYQQYVDKLWMYAQFVYSHPEPEIIARVVKRTTYKGVFDDDRDVTILGNDKMFSQDGNRQPLAEVFSHEGLFVSESDKYDEYGAFAIGAKMYKENRVIFHRTLDLARKDIALWTVSKGTPETTKNGFGSALLLILSEVRKRRKEPVKQRKLRDYSPVKQQKLETPDYNGWCGK